MTTYINQAKLIQEQVVFLRNSDIFTTTQRSVTTAEQTGTYDEDTTDSIARVNVKNIRSIVIGGVTQALGTDYEVDYGTGATNATITYTSAKSGAYTITYDYGVDKIFSDFPLTTLSIGSFPRLAVDILSITSVPGGFGNVNVSEVNFTVVAYAPKVSDIRTYLSTVRDKYIAAQTSFYYLKVVKPGMIGPILPSPRAEGKDKVFQQNHDFVSRFNYEVNN